MIVYKMYSFDICAFAVLSVLLCAAFFRRMTKGTTNRLYLSLLGVSVISCFFDIIAVIIDNAPAPELYWIQFLAHSLYLYFHNLTTPLYMLFIIAQTDTFHKLGRKNTGVLLIGIPVVFYSFVFVLNIFTGMVFTIEDGVYRRGGFIVVL